jgi:hypothetical protein
MNATLDGSIVAQIDGPLPSGKFQLTMGYKDETIIMHHRELDYLKEEASIHFGRIFWEDRCPLTKSF